MDRLNSQQRWNGHDGWGYATVHAHEIVPRCNIEAAAHRGYNDACLDLPFCRDYNAAPASWQRNYEIGRLWAIGFRHCGFSLPSWPETATAQVPYEISQLVEKMTRKIGAIRPETQGMREPDPDLPVLHQPMPIRRRRRR